MDRRQIALKLTMDRLGLRFAIDRFNDRLVLQKAVYLAQAAGIGLGYHYRWYLYGPYSPALTRDAYAVAMDLAAGNDESKGWRLDETSVERLEGVKPLFCEEDRGELPRWLELLASVHFLLVQEQVPEGSVSALRERLLAYEKDFSDEEVGQALGELRANELLAGSR